MSKLSSKTTEWLKQAEQKYISDMPEVTDENRSRVKYMQDGLKAVQEELARRLVDQKKSQGQPIEKIEQLKAKTERLLPTKEELQDQGKEMENEGIQDPSYTYEYVKFEKEYFDKTPFKTIKAPTVDREPEYINIELTDQKGKKYIRTYNRAQTKALCRKYFSNIHDAWVKGNRKLTNGFDNLLAFFLGWAEFDGKTPGLQDVLQDYKSYRKAKGDIEDSEAFRVAKDLYGKVISIISKKEQSNED
jgi:hypothetical protein